MQVDLFNRKRRKIRIELASAIHDYVVEPGQTRTTMTRRLPSWTETGLSELLKWLKGLLVASGVL